jgi:hypothetical protein
MMIQKFDGAGSSYLVTTQDDKGNALDGNEVYAITIPPNPPMKRFWSFMVYDNQTRSILATDQRTGGFDSLGEVVTMLIRLTHTARRRTVGFGLTGRPRNVIRTDPNVSIRFQA